jgi:flagellin-like protein
MRGEKAVSPVVATLILILIAVAAAAALYLWLVTWQGGITKTIGTPSPQATLTIGGSTSVYPFDELAVTQFEQNYTDVVISNNQGGSGAGMDAVCSGAVDIGAASFPVTAAGLVSSYGCSANVANTADITTVAYDAVDVIVSNGNTHGLLSINYDTLALIYEDATVATTGSPHATLLTTTEDGGAQIPTSVANNSAGLEWSQIPAAVGGAVINHVTENATNATGAPLSVVAGTGTKVAIGSGFDYFVNTSGPQADDTPCGFSICASGTQTIVTVARSDASGTTQSFEARLIDADCPSAGCNGANFASASTLNSPGSAGFTGCGGTNYISDCGYVATTTASGNPAVVAAVASNVNSIGYASDGIARAAGTVGLIPFLGVGQPVYTSTASYDGGILPTTGSSGTIALGIKAAAQGGEGPTSDYALGYLGWRPFELVTLTQATGEAQTFLTFVTDPANNIALAGEAQEVSIYSV